MICIIGLFLFQSAGLSQGRPKVGLVLSGGGAKGFAHIGVLKVLEEIGMPIDCITGTSMGSIVGALYAIGYSAEELEQLVGTTDWTRLFPTNPNAAILQWSKNPGMVVLR